MSTRQGLSVHHRSGVAYCGRSRGSDERQEIAPVCLELRKNGYTRTVACKVLDCGAGDDGLPAARLGEDQNSGIPENVCKLGFTVPQHPAEQSRRVPQK